MGATRGMTHRLTVIIPCKNEEANIGECLRSARKVADEVLVADSGSTDRTLEMVREQRTVPDHRARVRQLGRLQELGDPAGCS